MEVPITANGTVAFWLRPGRWQLAFQGTIDTSTVIALKSGSDSTGANHVAVTSSVTDEAYQAITGGLPEPEMVYGGCYYSLVTTDYGSSTGIQAVFRYLGQ